MNNNYVVCIPTYKRVKFLKKLLDDIGNQTFLPYTVVIVDGDPQPNEVLFMLRGNNYPWEIYYIPSNFGNLAYQRYLGWNFAKNLEPSILLYLDDDLEIHQKDALENLLAPIFNKTDVVGATGEIIIGEDGKSIRKFGNHIKTNKSEIFQDGDLTPVGNRLLPKRMDSEFAKVQWLRGGVMAFRMSAITSDSFSEDLFALTHVNCGMGEDTFISRSVGKKGNLLYIFNARFNHPSHSETVAYPANGKKLAYARAYSRRFLNDNYRIDSKPTFIDRLYLIGSYVKNNIKNWWLIFFRPAEGRFSYAWGYLRGSIRGLLQKPTAENLTPDIDWLAEAESVLPNVIRI